MSTRAPRVDIELISFAYKISSGNDIFSLFNKEDDPANEQQAGNHPLLRGDLREVGDK